MAHSTERHLFGIVLGNIIEAHRCADNMTQAQLAKTVCVSQSIVSRTEAGTHFPDAFLYQEFARVFGLQPDKLGQQVQATIDAVKAAANAVAAVGGKSWDNVEVDALAGLVRFVVLARQVKKAKLCVKCGGTRVHQGTKEPCKYCVWKLE